MVELLATVDLGPEIDKTDQAPSTCCKERSLTIEMESLRTMGGSGLARGQEHHTLVREQKNDSGGGDLRRYREARVSSGPTSTSQTCPLTPTSAPALRDAPP